MRMKFLSFLLMAKVKVLSYLFYYGQSKWLSQEQEEGLKEVKLIVFLNHTSLFEPLFIRFASWGLVWNVAHKLVVPGADITMKRPMTGRILKALLPGCIPISRKRDDSWRHFLEHVNHDVVTAILPEGRMKRRNGLDKHGKPMSARGGVADVLQKLNKGKMLFVYSGGLHHIQAPGQRWPRLFKTFKANLELIDIAGYKKQMQQGDAKGFTQAVIQDMNQRLAERVPG